ncbi:MAG: hypothetical protein FWE77_01070 [Clostridia bacterium]|nr:hypothetical protein [Clostridia bacterium]
MSKIHCGDCGSARDSREMRGCRSCGTPVCERCAARQASMCGDCAGQDECVVPE